MDYTVLKLREAAANAVRELFTHYAEIKEKSFKEGVEFEVVISTEDRDRHGEVIRQDGIEFQNYLKNPVVLWAHNSSEPPIGVISEIRREGKKTIAKGHFAPRDVNPFAAQIAEMYKAGIVRATSVGIIVKEYDEASNTITKSELVEVSFVPVPANPQALTLARSLGLTDEMLAKAFDTVKTVVSPHTTPTAPEDRPWDKRRAIASVRKWASRDGSGKKDTIDWAKYRKAFAWYDENDPENFTSYKLPHHEVIDGKLHVVWNGVRAAMAALFGARGGVDIPDNEWDGVYRHLARHYKQFEKEPPAKESKQAIAELLKAVVEDDEEEEVDEDQNRDEDLQNDADAQAQNTNTTQTTDDTPQDEKQKAETHKQTTSLAAAVGAELAQMQTDLDGVIKTHALRIVDLVKATDAGEKEVRVNDSATLSMTIHSLESALKALRVLRHKASEEKQTPDSTDDADGDTSDDETARIVAAALKAVNNVSARALQKLNERKNNY